MIDRYIQIENHVLLRNNEEFKKNIKIILYFCIKSIKGVEVY